MARQHTSKSYKLHPGSPFLTSKRFKNSPTRSKLFVARKIAPPTTSDRVNLFPLTSSPHRSHRKRFSNPRNGYPDFQVNAGMLEQETDNGEDDQDSDVELFQWEEEETLVSALMKDDVPEHSEHAQVMSLAHSLQDSFTSRGRRSKEVLAETLVPTANIVKKAHRYLDKVVDAKFENGFISFNDACVKMAKMALEEEDELKAAYVRTQSTIQDLFTELDKAYGKRDELWTNFQQELDESVRSASQDLEAVPENIERTIAICEKRSKELDKDGGSSKAKEKMLRGLIKLG